MFAGLASCGNAELSLIVAAWRVRSSRLAGLCSAGRRVSSLCVVAATAELWAATLGACVSLACGRHVCRLSDRYYVALLNVKIYDVAKRRSEIGLTMEYVIAVYQYPDYVQLMSYPFTLKVACTTSLQDEMVKAAKTGFCASSTDDQCVFQFVASCFDSDDPQVVM